MSNRSEFLCEYASRLLGRDLTEEEKALVSAETSRRGMQILVAGFDSKPKKTASKPKPKPKVKDKDIEAIVKEESKNEE